MTGPPTDDPLSILCSFHYYRGEDLDEMASRFRVPPRIFADSGAFSAFTQGAEIDVEEYAAWITRWRHRLEVVANLDDLHDPRKTWANQRRLEDLGIQAVPVFHMGSDFAWLKKYLDAGYRYLALGKMVGRELTPRMRWAVRCFQVARPYGAVFHAFGLTRPETIWQLPFYSADSSAWGSGQRFGLVRVWVPEESRFANMRLWDRRLVYRHATYLRSIGFEPEVFLDRSRYHRSYAAAVGAHSWLRFEEAAKRRHGAIPLPPDAWRHDTLTEGPRYFMSLGFDSDVADLAAFDRGTTEERAEAMRRRRAGWVEGPRYFMACSGSDDEDLAALDTDTIEDRAEASRSRRRARA